jgi:hypothetical protein
MSLAPGVIATLHGAFGLKGREIKVYKSQALELKLALCELNRLYKLYICKSDLSELLEECSTLVLGKQLIFITTPLEKLLTTCGMCDH